MPKQFKSAAGDIGRLVKSIGDVGDDVCRNLTNQMVDVIQAEIDAIPNDFTKTPSGHLSASETGNDGNTDVYAVSHQTEKGNWFAGISGSQWKFIEFGVGPAGVETPYPGLYGQYSYSPGATGRNMWVYYDEGFNKVFSHGNIAFAPVWNTRTYFRTGAGVSSAKFIADTTIKMAVM